MIGQESVQDQYTGRISPPNQDYHELAAVRAISREITGRGDQWKVEVGMRQDFKHNDVSNEERRARTRGFCEEGPIYEAHQQREILVFHGEELESAQNAFMPATPFYSDGPLYKPDTCVQRQSNMTCGSLLWRKDHARRLYAISLKLPDDGWLENRKEHLQAMVGKSLVVTDTVVLALTTLSKIRVQEFEMPPFMSEDLRAGENKVETPVHDHVLALANGLEAIMLGPVDDSPGTRRAQQFLQPFKEIHLELCRHGTKYHSTWNGQFGTWMRSQFVKVINRDLQDITASIAKIAEQLGEIFPHGPPSGDEIRFIPEVPLPKFAQTREAMHDTQGLHIAAKPAQPPEGRGISARVPYPEYSGGMVSMDEGELGKRMPPTWPGKTDCRHMKREALMGKSMTNSIHRKVPLHNGGNPMLLKSQPQRGPNFSHAYARAEGSRRGLMIDSRDVPRAEESFRWKEARPGLTFPPRHFRSQQRASGARENGSRIAAPGFGVVGSDPDGTSNRLSEGSTGFRGGPTGFGAVQPRFGSGPNGFGNWLLGSGGGGQGLGCRGPGIDDRVPGISSRGQVIVGREQITGGRGQGICSPGQDVWGRGKSFGVKGHVIGGRGQGFDSKRRDYSGGQGVGGGRQGLGNKDQDFVGGGRGVDGRGQGFGVTRQTSYGRGRGVDIRGQSFGDGGHGMSGRGLGLSIGRQDYLGEGRGDIDSSGQSFGKTQTFGRGHDFGTVQNYGRGHDTCSRAQGVCGRGGSVDGREQDFGGRGQYFSTGRMDFVTGTQDFAAGGSKFSFGREKDFGSRGNDSARGGHGPEGARHGIGGLGQRNGFGGEVTGFGRGGEGFRTGREAFVESGWSGIRGVVKSQYCDGMKNSGDGTNLAGEGAFRSAGELLLRGI